MAGESTWPSTPEKANIRTMGKPKRSNDPNVLSRGCGNKAVATRPPSKGGKGNILNTPKRTFICKAITNISWTVDWIMAGIQVVA